MTDSVRGERTAALLARSGQLRAALELAGDRLDQDVAAQARAVLTRIDERLALGVDHTVVALAGGTGSGKSSLFNAVSGLQLADVGARRPTTAEITACVWGSQADELLAWLGVGVGHSMQRESLLDADDEAALRGLILLDLPDHDSVEAAHRAVVDRLVPQADLVIWVVDPQKYADDALHRRYLQRLSGQDAELLVVLNQVDTLPDDQRGAVVADLGRLLAEDGLPDVPVLVTSTRTGQGVGELRDLLIAAVATRAAAARRAAAGLAAAAREVIAATGPEPDGAPLDVAPVVDRLAEAAGVLAAPDGGAGPGEAVRRRLVAVQPDAVEQTRSGWLRQVTDGLPDGWRRSVESSVPPAGELAGAVDAALGAVVVPAVRSHAGAVRASALAALLAGLAVGAVALGALVGGSGPAAVPWALPTAGLLVLVGVGLLVSAARLRRAAVRRRVDEVRRAGRAAVAQVVDVLLVQPAARILTERARVHELAAAAAGSSDPPLIHAFPQDGPPTRDGPTDGSPAAGSGVSGPATGTASVGPLPT